MSSETPEDLSHAWWCRATEVAIAFDAASAVCLEAMRCCLARFEAIITSASSLFHGSLASQKTDPHVNILPEFSRASLSLSLFRESPRYSKKPVLIAPHWILLKKKNLPRIKADI